MFVIFLVWMCMAQQSFTQNEIEFEIPPRTSMKGQRQGLQYIGVGYDIIKGNPEGDKKLGGVDPGFLITRKIFKLIHTGANGNGKMTSQTNVVKQLLKSNVMNEKNVADFYYNTVNDQHQIEFERQSSCYSDEENKVIKDTMTYQEVLDTDVGLSASSDVISLLKFKFGASEGFKKTACVTKTKNSVIVMEREICNMGRMRYKHELARARSWPVTNEFAASVCSLPSKDDGSNEETMAYINFIEAWGTHVVVEIDFGWKNTSKYINTLDTFVRIADKYSNTSVAVNLTGGEGAPIDISATASVNIGVLWNDSKHLDEFKNTNNKETILQGSKELPQPIAIKIKSIVEALKPNYWQTLKEFISSKDCKRGDAEDDVLKKKTGILKKLLIKYPQFVGAIAPIDLPIMMAITWPKGTYALPQTNSGCPQTDGRHEWNKGWRFQDTADLHAEIRSAKIPENIKIEYDSKDNTKSYYCIKAEENWRPNSNGRIYDRPWSPGKYCIYKMEKCPEGFVQRFIYWKDQRGWTSKGNNIKGSRPAGHYDKKTTKIYFCCRNDGPAENALFLPSGKPFALFPVEQGNCQKVYGMKSKEEIASWDTHFGTDSSRNAPVPVQKVTHSRVTLHYCYYFKA